MNTAERHPWTTKKDANALLRFSSFTLECRPLRSSVYCSSDRYSLVFFSRSDKEAWFIWSNQFKTRPASNDRSRLQNKSLLISLRRFRSSLPVRDELFFVRFQISSKVENKQKWFHVNVRIYECDKTSWAFRFWVGSRRWDGEQQLGLEWKKKVGIQFLNEYFIELFFGRKRFNDDSPLFGQPALQRMLRCRYQAFLVVEKYGQCLFDSYQFRWAVYYAACIDRN